MKLSVLKMKNCLAIKEKEIVLGKVNLITGASETGKTTIIDTIKKGLNNEDVRDLFTTKGENQSEIIIETDNELEITRNVKGTKSTKLEVKKGGMKASGPQSYLNELFGGNNLNPIDFFNKSDDEQAKELLQLLDIKLTEKEVSELIKNKPSNIIYDQHGLNVCEIIEKQLVENRRECGREEKSVKGSIDEMQLDIPNNYKPDDFRNVVLSDKFNEISKQEEINSKIKQAKERLNSVDDNIKEYDKNLSEGLIEYEEQMQREIEMIKQKYSDKKSDFQEKIEEKIKKENEYKLNAEKYLKVHEEKDTTELKEKVKKIEEGKNLLSMYDRLQRKIKEHKELKNEYDQYTKDINVIRDLPGKLLKKAKSPIDGLTVKNGSVLIDGLPLNNLSDGAKFRLAIKIAQATSGELKTILLNGFEQLNPSLQKQMIKEMLKTDYQYIITKVDDGDLKIKQIFEDYEMDSETGEIIKTEESK